MKKNIYLVLSLIFVLGLFARPFGLINAPPSLSWDEVSHGYNAFAILKTGADEWGQVLPIFNFRAYGDYPLPLYMYLSMPFIALFGLNEFSIRLLSVLLGTVLVVLVYFLAYRVTNNKYVGLFGALGVALSPVGILLSRQVIQAVPAIFLLTLGIYLFLEGIFKKKILLILGTISICVSAYAYHNTRILAPLFLLTLWLIYRKAFFAQKKLFITSFFIAGIFFIPLIPVVFLGSGSVRAEWVGILDQGAISQLDQSRNLSTLPDIVDKIIYNRPVYFLQKLISNYFGYFNPLYLGFNGGSHYQFSIPGFGVIYPFELPFFYIGLITLLLKFKKNSLEKKFLLVWLILAPIPAAITRDSYQVVRSVAMLPAIYITVAVGLLEVWKILNSRFKNSQKIFLAILGIIIVGIFINFYSYFNNLLNDYPKKYSQAWQYGYKQAIDYIQQNYNKYDKIFITKKYGEPHEFLLFYTKYDPLKYRNDPNLIRYHQTNWYWVDGFDKYIFVNDWEIKQKVICPQNQKCLLVTSPGNYPDNKISLETIDFLDNTPVFDIVEVR